MNWTLLLIAGAVIALLFVGKRLSFVSPEIAQSQLRSGALLVDVRSAGEYRARHLPGAVNIPLDELTASLAPRLADKNQVMLLHCLSGTRSGLARRQLKQLGYENVFNLGSYGRAQRIVNAAAR
jgi:rhodanese-related sulfurtransferase